MRSDTEEAPPDWLAGRPLTDPAPWLSLAGLVADRMAADSGLEVVEFAREALASGHPGAVECLVRLGAAELALWRTQWNRHWFVLRTLALQLSPEARRAFCVAAAESLRQWGEGERGNQDQEAERG